METGGDVRGASVAGVLMGDSRSGLAPTGAEGLEQIGGGGEAFGGFNDLDDVEEVGEEQFAFAAEDAAADGVLPEGVGTKQSLDSLN